MSPPPAGHRTQAPPRGVQPRPFCSLITDRVSVSLARPNSDPPASASPRAGITGCTAAPPRLVCPLRHPRLLGQLARLQDPEETSLSPACPSVTCPVLSQRSLQLPPSSVRNWLGGEMLVNREAYLPVCRWGKLVCSTQFCCNPKTINIWWGDLSHQPCLALNSQRGPASATGVHHHTWLKLLLKQKENRNLLCMIILGGNI